MENMHFNFNKFVEDIEKREKTRNDSNRVLQAQLDAWKARRKLEALYREKSHNRIYSKR